MSSSNGHLLVEDLPPDIAKMKLVYLFKNTRGQGGGPVKEVKLDVSSRSAIVLFEDKTAVDTVLNRGNTVTIDGHTCKVSRGTSQDDVNSRPLSAMDRQSFDELPDFFTSNDDGNRSLTSKNIAVQINLRNSMESKDTYDLFLLDKIKNYNKEKIFLDGLKMAVFVEVCSYEDADKLCEADLTDELSIESIEMAPPDVFGHYPNILSIHGVDARKSDVKKRLFDHLKEKIGYSPDRLMSAEEPLSGIIMFHIDRKVSDLYSLAWKCVGTFEGTSVITAPVKLSTSIHANVSGKIDANTLERYFKLKGGGGPVDSCKKHNDTSYIVDFKLLKDASSVLERVDHAIGESKITVSQWHQCLSKEAYKNFLELCQRIENAPKFVRQASVDKKHSGHHDCEFYYKLKPDEYNLMKRTDLLKTIDKPTGVTFELDDDSLTVRMQGTEKSVNSIKSKFGEKLLEFESKAIIGPEKWILDFLKDERAQKIINEILDRKNRIAFIYSEGNTMMCSLDEKTEKSDHIYKIISDSFHETEEIWGDQVLALTCKKGKEFLSNLTDNSDVPCTIHVDEKKNAVKIVTMETNITNPYFTYLWYKIKQYMQNNKTDSKNFSFPSLKFDYILKYLDKELSSIKKSLKSAGVMVKEENNSIAMNGLESGISKAQNKLAALRDKVTVQDINIIFFGAKEYFASDRGKKVMDNIAKQHNCLIQPLDSSMPDGLVTDTQQAGGDQQLRGRLVASCSLEKLKIQFVVGDITSLKGNAIINPVSDQLELKKGMNKAIAQYGGHGIETELSRSRGQVSVGDVVATKGGRLPYSTIYHLVLEKDADPQQLCGFVKDCLRKADQENVQSIVMPVLGCGTFKMPLMGACLNISKAIKDFADKASSLCEVIICDNKKEHIVGIMDRFENVTKTASIEDDNGGSDLDADSQSNEGGSHSGSETTKIGSISFTLLKGNILKDKSEAIVCGIREDMDLKGAGSVSKQLLSKCGDSLQAECSQQASELKDSGAVAIQVSGLRCSSVIFVNMSKYSRSWGKGVTAILSLADKEGFSSVALPALGTGSKNADIKKLKASILKSINDFGHSKPDNVEDVRLVVYGDKLFQTFRHKGESQPRGKKEQKGSPPAPIISRAISFQVAFEDAENGAKVEKKLLDHCKESFKKHSVNNAGTGSMSDRQVENIIREGLKQEVKVTVKRETDVVILETFDMNAIMTMQDVIRKELLEGKDREHLKQLHAVETAFKWQFMRKEKWVDFKAEHNHQIEEAFNKKKISSVEIEDSEGRKYKIDFQSMKEFKKSRRDDSLKEVSTVNRFYLGASGEALPDNWDKMNGENLKIVLLSPSSKEYQDVQAYFTKCGATPAIKKIERIQNEVLYQQYASKRRYFEKNNPKGTENEKKLFHGSDGSSVAGINASGFNRGFCGKNATVYGNGVYFAEQSSYSVNYAKPDASGQRRMYLACVLVGVSTPSTNGMTYLPNQPNKNIPFDSGRGPNMYIIFHDCQAYPEYLITF